VLAIFLANTWGAVFRPWFTNLGRAAQSVEMVEAEQLARNTNFPPPAAYRERVDNAGAGRVEAYQATVAANWQRFVGTIRTRISRHVLWNEMFMVFIIGFIVGRRGWLQNAARYQRGFLVVGAAGIALAVAGNVSEYFIKPEGSIARSLQWQAANYGVTMTYIALFAVAFGSWPAIAKRFRIFTPIGQIGLTGYLMQSVVMTLLFERYGLGLKSPPTTWYLLLDVAFFFVIQLAFARWWMSRYRFGPAEWVWRSMTYGELQPMRRALAPPVVLPPGVAPSWASEAQRSRVSSS
jgi:uncharacterized protein